MNRLVKGILFLVGLCVLGIIASNIFVRLSTAQYMYDLETVPDAQTVLILGAGIKANGELSPVLKDRVDLAHELYAQGKVTDILISGNNKKVLYPSDDEVTPVREYLLAQKVPAEVILVDHEGFDTYTSMYRAKDTFEVTTLIISTQQFHLPRAVFIARSLGIDAIGVAADNGTYQDKNYIREFFAQPKAVWDVVWGRVIVSEEDTF